MKRVDLCLVRISPQTVVSIVLSTVVVVVRLSVHVHFSLGLSPRDS